MNTAETRTIEDLETKITSRLSEHAGIALMFRGIFEMREQKTKHEGSQEGADDIWRGLAVIADRLHDDCEALEGEVHELRRMAEGGAR